MKKLKIFGAAVMAASLLFTSCAPAENPSEPTPTPIPDPDPDPNPDPDPDPNPDPNPISEYTIEFSDAANSSTYADGVYTITVVNANDAEWGNQIFIKNPNKEAGIAAGDKIHTAITLEADKEIATMFVKNQFNGGNYTGIDTQKNLPANEATVFDIYGTVTDDFDDSASIVLALRGNAASTTLKISDIKVEKIENYSVEKVVLITSADKAAFGESIELKATDQYGIKLDEVTFEIKTEGAVSTIEGNKLTAGNTAEVIDVVAKFGDKESDPVSITVYKATYSDIVLFDIAESVNEMKFDAIEPWWGTYTVNVTEEGIVTNGDANGCYGVYLNNVTSYKTGAKLEITYIANNDFAVKPVAPDKEFMLSAADTEKTELVELGDAAKIEKIGIVFKSNASSVTIKSIKIINE